MTAYGWVMSERGLTDVCREAQRAGMSTRDRTSMRGKARRLAREYPFHSKADHARLIFQSWTQRRNL